MTGPKPAEPYRRRAGAAQGGLGAAGAPDLGPIETLLAASGLPVEGVGGNLHHFFVYRGAGGKVVGAVGLEIHGTSGLLRSAVVAEPARGRGIAAMLVERALQHAGAEGCRAVYLLTLDAERYFDRFGFAVVGRDEAPEPIRRSAQFSALCPDTALLMRRQIRP